MLALLLLFASMQEVPAGDPLAPARAGKLRCIEPDAAGRNCRAIIRYNVRDDGSFDATVSGFVGNDGSTIIVYRSSGMIEGGAVCTVIRPYDLLHGTLYRNGKPVPEQAAQPLQDQIRIQLQDLAGKKRCYVDRPDGNRTVSGVTLNGAVQPGTQSVAWVSPDEGYALSW